MTARPNQTSKKATVSKTATKTAATQSVETSTTSPAPKKTAAASAAGAATAPTVEKAAPKPSAPVGYVSFVGSGPGDPELLTVRAVELLREAEVVVTEVPSHTEHTAMWWSQQYRTRRRRSSGDSMTQCRTARRRVDSGPPFTSSA